MKYFIQIFWFIQTNFKEITNRLIKGHSVYFNLPSIVNLRFALS